MKKGFGITLMFLFNFNFIQLQAQAVPAKNENIPFLVTFGNKAEKNWGDDDYNQIS